MVYFKPINGGDDATVFNMGVSTLMGINNILEELSKQAPTYHLSLVTNQSAKIRMVKALFLRSVPLLGNDVPVFRERIFSLKEATINSPTITSGKGEIKVYSHELERELDNLIIDIQLALQSKNVFMPSKADPKHGWKQ